MGVDHSRVNAMLKIVGLDESRRAQAGRKLLAGNVPTTRHRPRAARRSGGTRFFDEPVNGSRPRGECADARVAHGLRRNVSAVLLSSHCLHQVQATADRLAVIVRGQICRRRHPESTAGRCSPNESVRTADGAASADPPAAGRVGGGLNLRQRWHRQAATDRCRPRGCRRALCSAAASHLPSRAGHRRREP